MAVFDKLRNLLGGKKEEALPSFSDFSAIGADIHSHLIPGIDDGVQTLDDTIYLLRQYEALGYKKVFTSPHVGGGYNNTTQIITEGREKVREAIKQNGINIEFDTIAEYYLDETLAEKIEKRDLLSFGKNYVLVEFSFLNAPQNIRETIYKIQTSQYRFVLAHPERYSYFQDKDFREYKSLKDRNVYFQINMLSLAGRYGKGAQVAAERMIDEKMVDFIGSDLHGIKHMEMIKQAVGLKYMQKIMNYDKLLNKTL